MARKEPEVNLGEDLREDSETEHSYDGQPIRKPHLRLSLARGPGWINRKGDRLYVTVAKPGVVTVYDLGDLAPPRFLQTIPAAPGAHHLVFSPDEKYLFAQNSLLNLPGMDDGSITVIDIAQGKAIECVNTLKDAGYNPNSIVLLPSR